MYDTACVVNLYSSPLSTSGTPYPYPPTGTCCGILIDTQQGLVLAHASCLSPFLEKGDFDLDTLTSTLKKDQGCLKCEVLLRKEEEKKVQKQEDGSAEGVLGVLVSTSLNTDASVSKIDVGNERAQDGSHTWPQKRTTFAPPFLRFPATVVHFFHCTQVRESLQQLMPESSWDLLDSKDNNNNNNSSSSVQSAQAEVFARTLVSSFIIVQLSQWKPYRSYLPIWPTQNCSLGDRVEICSTPFAGLKPETFFNSHSRGIVSNLAGKDNCLLLSDARCILGGEGAPLYTIQCHGDSTPPVVRCITGVVVASLCWKNQEWVGFCLAANISAVLHSASPHLQRLLQGHSKPKSLLEATVKKRGSASQQHGIQYPEVVMLKVGGTWGSGVVVDAISGTILTCSHVIREAHLFQVEVQRVGDEGGVGRGKVLYRQHPVRQQFDLALVQCPPQSITTTTPTHTLSRTSVIVATPEEGMEVFVVGHALFGAEHHLPPSVTSGVISKVIKVSDVPVMIQTTCAVHAGASGGALVDTTGRLLGIVVCNTKDNSSGASFPHVNMSIPACTVWPVVSHYLRTKEVRRLEKLQLYSSEVDTVWSLGSLQNAGVTPQISKL